MPICLRLFEHWARRAASRALWTAGNSSAARMAMMAITTNSSISVKPRLEPNRLVSLSWFSFAAALLGSGTSNSVGRLMRHNNILTIVRYLWYRTDLSTQRIAMLGCDRQSEAPSVDGAAKYQRDIVVQSERCSC